LHLCFLPCHSVRELASDPTMIESVLISSGL